MKFPVQLVSSNCSCWSSQSNSGNTIQSQISGKTPVPTIVFGMPAQLCFRQDFQYFSVLCSTLHKKLPPSSHQPLETFSECLLRWVSPVCLTDSGENKVPNASPTAASASSDMYGAAVLDACEQIKARMEPIASKNKHSSFAELVRTCYMERIDLSAHGFYATPDIGFDWKTGKGNPFRYFTYGAAFAEVEIDTLTGDFHTRTADIIMDLGHSLNPAIDVGQIEGGFIQGLGWVALEELKWGDAEHKWIRPGYLYTCGPGSYKIPSVNDIPLNFKVSLLKGVGNTKAIHSSKAVGEPPFFLSCSVLFAIKDAIIAARAEVGCNEWFPLDNPATPERIRMACTDDFTTPFAASNFRPKLSV